jgi:aminoglycoside phosphotransferase family enzyme/predicted kinase
VAETHSAVVFFVGDRAYKLKKPVDLGFLDFRRREDREAVCHREVALNRRLAPDVYLGVADVVAPGGEVCDHLVVMRRMPAGRRLSALVRAGEDVNDELWHLAHLLAAFHARAERGPAADEAAGREQLARRWATNTGELLALDAPFLDVREIEAVDRLAHRYLAGRGRLFERRIDEGRACDGHGDLLADDIFCLDDGPRVLDCIEFDTRLRLDDALADVAFLAMDLERLGRPDLAERFLAAYREHANDSWPSSLAHHHVAYRAQVRAKVAAIRATQGIEPSVAEARQLLAMAWGHLEAGAVRLVVVGGLPGTGKTTLALALGDALGATALRSDEIRKELAGLPANRPARACYGMGIYTPQVTAATYRAMLSRARVALELGETVVLDASFTEETWRAAARALAADTDADIVELRCSAPAGVADERIRQRLAAGGDASDATPEIAAIMAAAEVPWPSAHTVDMASGPAAGLAAAMDAIRRTITRTATTR